jgi:hypothetical protein
VADASAFLETHGVPAAAREFRVRQEFFRYRWDMRVRNDGGTWTVTAVKPERPNVEAHGSSEGNALRLALATALRHDVQTP